VVLTVLVVLGAGVSGVGRRIWLPVLRDPPRQRADVQPVRSARDAQFIENPETGYRVWGVVRILF
jgi:hypothetical protein